MMKKRILKAGSDLNHFALTIDVVMKLLDRLSANQLESPTALTALITQLLGLSLTLDGTGDSPFSLASIAIELKGCGELVSRLAEIPIPDRRLVSDDIHDMLAPLLLDEAEAYIELAASTQHRRLLSENGKEAEFRQHTAEKFRLLAPLFARLRPQSYRWAHIGHFGGEEDLYRESAFLRELPAADRELWYRGSFPFAVELQMRGFMTPGDPQEREARGWMILLANPTQQLLADRELRLRKLNQAVKLAAKLGASIVGMAGLTASFAQGGHALSRSFPELGFSTGHAYTIANIIDIASGCIDKIGLDISKATVAVIGAAGSIGSGCARLIARQLRPRRMFLSDLSPIIARTQLANLAELVRAEHPAIELELSSDKDCIRQADLVIVCTNSPVSIVEPSHFQPGTIVIDDSFPKNVPQSVLAERPDVIVLEGGIVQMPYRIDVNASRPLRDSVDAPVTRTISCKQIYGCMTESLILALRQRKGNYGLGMANLDLAQEIFTSGREFGFSRAPFQSFDFAIGEERFNATRASLAARGLLSGVASL